MNPPAWAVPKQLRRSISHLAGALLGLTAILAGARATSAQTQATSTIKEIRKELMKLPYYGVFDFIAFSYDKGTVTLMGYAYHSTLKHDAARAAKRAPGGDQVIDEIE